MKGIRYVLLGLGCLLCTTLQAEFVMPYPLDTIDGKIYYQYKVERSIGLYRISKNFGVTQEAILEANPGLQSRGLHYDEVILVPAKGMTIQSSPEQQKPLENPRAERFAKKRKPIATPIVSIDTIVETVDTLLQDSTFLDKTLTKVLSDTNAIRLAFMLPLQADAIKRDRGMDRFYDFYAGALIAIHEMQSTGQTIEVFTYDVGKTTQKIENLLNNSVWKKVDAIIGPAYGAQVTKVADFAQKDSTWILVPFLANVASVESNPYMLKFNPSVQAEADTMACYLSQYGDSINCVLLEPKEGEVVPAGITALHEALKQYNIPTSTISLHDILLDSLDIAFRKDVENIVIFNTEKFGNLHAVLPHLTKGYTNYRITLFSHYSWQNEKIILPQIYTSIFDVPQLEKMERYNELFDLYFRHSLAAMQPRYDLLGYDLTSHLLHLLRTNINSESIDSEIWQGLQSNIQYHSVSSVGGFENKMIYIIRK